MKPVNLIKVVFNGINLDLDVTINDDEYEWSVFDVESDHTTLLNTLLHEAYDMEITDLIFNELNRISQEYELEQKLSALQEAS